MIKAGSRIVLHTSEAEYTTCEMITMSPHNVTVKYHAGQKREKKTGRMVDVWQTDTIARKDILHMSERT